MSKENPSRRLTHTFVKSITTPGRYGAGRGGLGLSLLVKRTADGRRWSRTWSQRIRIGKNQHMIGLGSFPVMTLAMARERCLENARKVAQGEDILKPSPKIPTVAEAFEEVITERAPGWSSSKTRDSWYRSLAFSAKISSRLVSDVKPSDIRSVITPLWHPHPKTARELRGHLFGAMQWAVNQGYRDSNPASPGVTNGLGKQARPVHHKSLAHPLLGSALAQVSDSDAWWAEKACLIFLAFTGVRSGEVRLATWEEIDLDTATWTIPAPRMKNKIEHKVPLSTQAIQVLLHARDESGRSQGIIFPPQRGGQSMDAGRLSKLLKRLRLPFVPHGLRSSFRNWAASRPHIAHHTAEMVLAHTPEEAVVKAYLNDVFFEERQPVMQEWSDYLYQTMDPVDPVISTPHPQAKERTAGKDPSKATPARKKKTADAAPPADEIPEAWLPEQPANRKASTRSQQRRRSDRIAQRICVDAGSDNHGAAPGKTRCEDCAEIHRVGRRKSDAARRERKKSELALVKNSPATTPRAMDKNTAAAQ